MPAPISSSSSTPSASTDYDPSLDEAGKMCRADAPNGSPAPPSAATSSQGEAAVSNSPSVPKLVSSVPPAPSALPPTASSLPAFAANNNAQRTSERSGLAPYAAAGTTAADDSVYVAMAGLKGRDPKSGVEAEVLSASIQVGAQNEAQFGLVRVGGTSGNLTGSVEAFTARANLGVHNDDGSTGFNVGAGATALGFEATFGHENSLTCGLAASVGQGVSVGLRDLDGDGKKELCGRFSSGPISVDICLENPL